jgi:hypothetical protein
MVYDGLVFCGGLVVHNVCGVGSIFVVLNYNKNPKTHLIIFVNKPKKPIQLYVSFEMKEPRFIATLY